jgi:hypothetical protein
MQTTWKPHTEHGKLTTRSNLPDSVYAFPKQKKEPMTDASHVRNALARFDQVEACRMRTAISPSPTSRRPPSITASTSRRRAGASSAARLAAAQLHLLVRLIGKQVATIWSFGTSADWV